MFGLNVTQNRTYPTHSSTPHAFSYAQIVFASVICLMNGTVVILFKVTGVSILSPTNRILFSLSIADFLTGVTVFLHAAIELDSSIKRNFSYRILVDVFTTAISISAILHICLISTERLFIVFFPLKSRVYFTSRKVKVCLACTWLLATISSGVQLIWLSRVLDGDITAEDDDVLTKAEPIYSVTSAVVFMAVPFIFTAVIYTKILLKIRSLRKFPSIVRNYSVKTAAKDNKAVFTFVAMFGCLVLLSGPYFMIRLLIDMNFSFTLNVQKIVDYLYLLKITVSIINPILYVTGKGEIRNGFRRLSNRRKSTSSLFSKKMSSECTRLQTASF